CRHAASLRRSQPRRAPDGARGRTVEAVAVHGQMAARFRRCAAYLEYRRQERTRVRRRSALPYPPVIEVIRYSSPSAFLDAVRPLLMAAEAENNLLLGFAEGLARGSPPAASPYLATAQSGRDVRACSAYLAPFKLLLSQSDRETI